MEPEGSSPYTQEPATCPYPELDQSSQQFYIAILMYTPYILLNAFVTQTGSEF